MFIIVGGASHLVPLVPDNQLVPAKTVMLCSSVLTIPCGLILSSNSVLGNVGVGGSTTVPGSLVHEIGFSAK